MAEANTKVCFLPENKTSHVFVVHALEDVKSAQRIQLEFERNGLSCTINERREIASRDRNLSNDQVHQFFTDTYKIKRSCVVILLFSKNFFRHGICEYEGQFSLFISTSLGREVLNVIPLSLDDSTIPKEIEVAVQEMSVDGNFDSWWPKLLSAVIGDVECQLNRSPNKRRDELEEELYSEKANLTFLFRWIEVLMQDNSSQSDSRKESAKISDLSDKLVSKLRKTSLQDRINFIAYSDKIGLSHFVGQIGIQNIHRILMDGCGMEVKHSTLILRWESFEQNLQNSNVTLGDVVCFGEQYSIRKILFSFNENTQKKIDQKYGPDWQGKFVQLAENILQERFGDGEYGRMAYRVRINGDANMAVKRKVNNSAKSLYLKKCAQLTGKYSSVEERIATYKEWPEILAVIDVQQLAKAGFIYTGCDDTIVCFSCNQTLYGLEIFTKFAEREPFHLVPWFNHACWSPECQHILDNQWIYKDIQQYIDLVQEIGDSAFQGRIYKDYGTRFRSFNTDIPEDVRRDFAEAGFYSDHGNFGNTKEIGVLCFSCAVNIFVIDVMDDPWIEHVRWSPECKHVEEVKGKHFVDERKEMLRRVEKKDGKQTELMIETIMLDKKHAAGQEEKE